jgi:hypothetical protein
MAFPSMEFRRFLLQLNQQKIASISTLLTSCGCSGCTELQGKRQWSILKCNSVSNQVLAEVRLVLGLLIGNL